MIKLLWNTNNQKKPRSEIKKIREKEEQNYVWGLYHKKSSDKWIEEILKKIQYKVIKNEADLNKEDILIIIDSGVEDKIEYYNKLNLICSKIFLFHLGDEFGFHNLEPIYNNCNFIWRPFCSTKYFMSSQKIKCIPIGYKSGVSYKNLGTRNYKWAFTGTPHKSSRHDLLFQFSDIKPFFCHKTKKFDKNIITVDKMNEVLSTTDFIPCPNGFFHPETYRVYEALECGCIPIVENAYRFYDKLFPNNPFIKIDKWSDAKFILKGWDSKQIEKKREECKIWWGNEKNSIQDFVSKKIIL